MMISRAMGARKPGSQGERAISVKTIAQGMPDDLAEPVVTAACFLFCRRAMGCGQHPAFPAPFHLEEGDVCKARTQMRRESVEICLEESARYILHSCPASRLRQGFGAATSPRARRSLSGGGKRGIQYFQRQQCLSR